VQAPRKARYTCALSTCLIAMWSPTLATLALCTMLPGAPQAVTCLHQPLLMALHAYGGFTRCRTVHLQVQNSASPCKRLSPQFGLYTSVGGFLKPERSSLSGKSLAEGRSNEQTLLRQPLLMDEPASGGFHQEAANAALHSTSKHIALPRAKLQAACRTPLTR